MKSSMIRNNPWSSIPTHELAKIYSTVRSKLAALKLSSTINYEVPRGDLTEAESLGQYVRELFVVYQSIHEAMKTSREWVALYARSTYHSKADYPDSIIVDGDESDDGQVQLRGFSFDPVIFEFTWQDNSLVRPWAPWNWRLGIFSEDCDDTHYFVSSKGDQLIVGSESKIMLYQVDAHLPDGLRLFHRS
jgi:hypothetical protein